MLTSTGAAQATLDHAFNYDDLDRLTQWTQNTTIHTYSYDLSGNRQTLGIVGLSPYTYTTAATSNRLSSVAAPTGGTLPSKANTYDAAGNLTNDNTITLTYSDRGRLANIKKTVSGTVKTTAYLFNGLEQRVKKSGPTDQVVTGASYYSYDEASHTIGEYDANLKVMYETVYLGDTPVAVLKQNTTGTGASAVTTTSVYYVYSDQIDTPRVITRATDNKMVWRWDAADPFGLFYPQENPSTLAATPAITYTQPAFTYNNRFPGQTYDRESGLHYNHHRDYDPYLGRYIESDPIGLSGGINTYSYVEAEPLMSKDPRGLIKMHGNWCGPDWTGGFDKSYDQLTETERRAALPPVTPLDACCKTHDIDYADCRKKFPCDSQKRKQCFTDADRHLGSCAGAAGSNYGANIFTFGDPQSRIKDYMDKSDPAAEKNAKDCECEK